MGNKTKRTSKNPQTEKTVIDISCEHVWREISRYVEDDVDADLRRRMEEHFKQCAHCRAVLDGTRNLIQLVGDGVAFGVPAGFGSRLYRKLEERLGKNKKRGSS